MTSLYEVLKRSKTAPQLAPDMFTALWAKSITAEKTIELSGQVPLFFKANGEPLLDFLISGNTVQNGTPTPDSPIMPQGTGERTGNLFDGEKIENCAFLNGSYDNPVEGTVRNIIYIPVVGGNTYTFSINNIASGTSFHSVCSVDKPALGVSYLIGGNTTFITHGAVTTFTRTIPNSANWWAIQIISLDNLSNNIMINEGSTALPYEPYGYKIQLSSANTTTPIYLGEVETTRQVKKQVVTISRIIESGTPNMKIAIVALDTSLVSPRTALSTVVPYGSASTPETFYYVNANNIGIVGAVGDTDEQIIAKYEGSILYYGIAETTGIVDEPLMKIGKYADTVSCEQAGVEIPTNKGSTTLDVLTTVKPSNVSIKYRV